MFPPQFGLYEQVKQSQLEMERSAQLDLEINTTHQDTPSLLTYLEDKPQKRAAISSLVSPKSSPVRLAPSR